MKLAQIFLVLIISYLIIGVIDATINEDLTNTGISTGNVVLDMILQPWNWTNQSFWILLATLGVSIGLVVGTSIITKSDLSSLSFIAASFLGLGSYMLLQIYNFINKNLTNMIATCTSNEVCFESNLITSIIVGSLGLMYFFSVLEWWAWRQTSNV